MQLVGQVPQVERMEGKCKEEAWDLVGKQVGVVLVVLHLELELSML